MQTRRPNLGHKRIVKEGKKKLPKINTSFQGSQTAYEKKKANLFEIQGISANGI